MLEPLNLVDLMQRAQELSGKYENVVIARVNDHVVRMSLMTEAYFWHYHPNSDETFIGLEGIVILELVGQRVELGPGQMFTVPKGMKHRTAPAGVRSINLTIENAEMQTLT
jgi:mannose-6-phosphate isomerase-like protein (cupin superfamily)